MAEPLENVRHMRAEGKFFEAQLEIERLLTLNQTSRPDILPLYLEILEEQNKKLPDDLCFEAAVTLFQKEPDRAIFLIQKIGPEFIRKNFCKVQNLKISIADKKGKIEELYKHLSEYQFFLYEAQIPLIPEQIQTLSEKYFKKDFGLKLQRLALVLLLNDLDMAENIIHELIQLCVERSAVKGSKEKIKSLHDILKVHKLGYLEMYANYCHIYLEGIQDKKDFKKLIELIIYSDDFKFQAHLLNLIDKLGLFDVAQDYSEVLKLNKDYSYIYFDKYYSGLKKYFSSVSKKVVKEQEPKVEIDLKLEKILSENSFETRAVEEDFQDSLNLLHTLKHQNYSTEELIELSVSFLESNLPKVALKAADMVLDFAQIHDDIFLKASYLKVTSLMMLKDFRAALDTSLMALERSKRKDDILCFLYAQAEIYLQLGNKSQAKEIYKKILTVDSRYRLAKERFEKLNEV